jgi:SpoVK/Ycf46/Vps4 family AAA+-type ATPase
MNTYDIIFDQTNKKISLSSSNVSETIKDEDLVQSACQIFKEALTTPIDYDWDLLQRSLNSVHCQEDNIVIIFNAIKRWLRRPKKTKPLVFLLAGTSGTGKSFTAKQVAGALTDYGYIQDDDFSMNEYQNEDTVNKFLGSPKGYIGSEDDTRIFALRKKSDKLVVVLNELDKAHQKILTAMMEWWDRGTLSNGKGEVFDFKDTIIFMTSNLAMDELVAKKRELISRHVQSDSADFKTQIKQILNTHGMQSFITGRIDELLVYNTLDAKNIAKIGLQEIRILGDECGLKINKIHLPHLINIAENCCHNVEGARFVRRLVETMYMDMFQDYNGKKEGLFDIDENKELIKSNDAYLQIDDIINQITFESEPKQERTEQNTTIRLPNSPYFTEISPDAYTKAVGLLKIEGGQSGEGTGFIISPDGYILTCAHCIVPGKSITFISNDKEYTTNVVYKNDNYKNDNIDVAILKIEATNLPYLLITSSMVGLLRGAEMGLLAYPKGSNLGKEVSYTKGTITKYENGLYFTDANATHGSSGGAFFNVDDGIVYGVLRGGYGEDGANLNVATDIRQLHGKIKMDFYK